MSQFNTITSPPPGAQKARFDFIDRACGLAICMVVFGHILFPETLSIDWYKRSEMFIYKFHMPLFIFLSGYLAFFSASRKQITSEKSYVQFQKKKLSKFLPVYFLFSLYSILVDILYHQASTDEINHSIYSFFFTPTKGSAVFLWYLYILIGFYLVTPFLINLKRSTLCLLLAISFLLTNVSLTPVFCFDFFCKFFFFFLWGGLVYKHSNLFLTFLDKNGKWILIVTLLLSIVDVLTYSAIPFQVISMGMIPSVLYISRLDWPEIISKIFITIGVGSFAIYLLNTSLINLYYILFKRSDIIGIGAFFIFSCFIITVGLSLLIRVIFNKLVPSRVYVL